MPKRQLVRPVYSFDQYRADCARISGLQPLTDRRLPHIQIPSAPPVPVIAQYSVFGLELDDMDYPHPNQPSGRIEHASAVACGLGPRPSRSPR
jgi:hypothetical protein